jgi:CspA family cold shock protein
LRGKVKFFNIKKNYGFISTKGNNEDVYFSSRMYPRGYLPHESHIVEFGVVETDRGPEATDIQVLRYDE